MPEIISCPECSRKLRVPDEMLGKQVKCPGCGKIFTAAAGTGGSVQAQPPRPSPRQIRAEEEGDDRPRRRPSRREEEDEDDIPRRRDEDERDFDVDQGEASAWGKLRIGATMHVIAVCLTIAAIAIGFVGGLMVSASGSVSMMYGFQIILNLLRLGAFVLALVGSGFFIAGPPRTGAKPLAITTLSMGIAQIVIILAMLAMFYQQFLNIMDGINHPKELVDTVKDMLHTVIAAVVMSVLTGICWLAEMATRLLYFKKVATYVKAHGVAQSAFYLLILGGVMVLSCVGMIVLIFGVGAAAATTAGGAPSKSSQDAMAGVGFMGLACGCINLVLSLGWMVWYVVVVFLFRGAVVNYISRNHIRA